MADTDFYNFTVIIPTYRAERELPTLIKALKDQSLPPKEILVIDSSPDENTLKEAYSLGAKGLKIPPQCFNHGLTRTLAAQKARGEILVFLTQDALPAHHKSLERLLGAFSSPEIAAAYGRQLAPTSLGLWAELHRLYNYPDRSEVFSYEDRLKWGLRTVFFSNSFGAYRRKCLAQIGWFPKVPALEDVYAVASLMKRGWKVAYVAEAVVWHGHKLSLKEEFERYSKIGAFYRQHPWILKEYGKPLGEGGSYIRFAWKELGRRSKRYLFPLFLIRQLVRLLGYWKGLYGIDLVH